MLPPKARAAFNAAGKTKGTVLKAGRAISNATSEPVEERLELITDAAFVAAAKRCAAHLLELVTDRTTKLMDCEQVLKHHRSAGRDVESLADLKTLDLKDLDDYTRRMALKWSTGGALQGGVSGRAKVAEPAVSSVLWDIETITSIEIFRRSRWSACHSSRDDSPSSLLKSPRSYDRLSTSE
ncbi:hypothetical protein [Streptosporangium amethystogenes]|uniref:hypothetical protein n=1 Tax=Streptosporangium amethystogenes TaxID=2002 RepID=UPI0012F95E77|nr:hypothetical protein [Streptosporangium amethystogenes]